MAEENINNSFTREKEAVNILVDGLTLFDDDLMSRVFDKNKHLHITPLQVN